KPPLYPTELWDRPCRRGRAGLAAGGRAAASRGELPEGRASVKRRSARPRTGARPAAATAGATPPVCALLAPMTRLALLERHLAEVRACRRCPAMRGNPVVGPPVLGRVIILGQA